jgi:hypothetical protein
MLCVLAMPPDVTVDGVVVVVVVVDAAVICVVGVIVVWLVPVGEPRHIICCESADGGVAKALLTSSPTAIGTEITASCPVTELCGLWLQATCQSAPER